MIDFRCALLLLFASAAADVTKTPADRGVVSAGGGQGAPTFVSDPGVLADNEGLHLFFSNIFCAKAGAWYFSWDPADVGGCNIMNATYGIGYAFSADAGVTWEYAPGPAITPGPAAWDAAAVETPFARVVNGTLHVFYSARGVGADGKTEFRSRYQVGVATLALGGRTLRDALLRDGEGCAKRAAPLLPHNLVAPNALDNNVQEPSAVWNDEPPGWEIFAIGLGLALPAAPIDGRPGQRVTGLHALRYTFPGGALPAGVGGGVGGVGSAAVPAPTVMTTDAPVNIIEVRKYGAGEYHMWGTSIVGGNEYHQNESLVHATSSDGLMWTGAAATALAPDGAGSVAFDDWGIMAPTVAVLPDASNTTVLLYSAWQLQGSPCLPVPSDGRFGEPLSAGRCCLSNIGRAVVTDAPPTPPPPPPTFKCLGSQCVAAASGVSKAVCESACVVEQLYQCVASTCSPASTGVPQATCKAICGPDVHA